MSTLRVNTIQEADGTVFSRVLQIVQNTTNSRLQTSSTTYVASSHFVTITPTAASSKILLLISGEVNTQDNNRSAFVDVYRSVNGGTFAGIAPVGSTQTVGANDNNGFIGQVRGSSSRIQVPFSINYVDTPSYSVGNAITYKLYARAGSGSSTGEIEMPSTNQAQPIVCIAMEIAA